MEKKFKENKNVKAERMKDFVQNRMELNRYAIENSNFTQVNLQRERERKQWRIVRKRKLTSVGERKGGGREVEYERRIL